MKLKDLLKEGSPKKGDYVKSWTGTIGLINKASGRTAYVKYPTTPGNKFDTAFDLKDSGEKHKGKTLWIEE
jgi:hypothetical protein